MSNLAYARPVALPVEKQHEEHPRHIEVVATRDQRRARPKVAYAVATVVSLGVIFAAQLLLSILVSDGAYQITSLQQQQRDLLRSEQALTENLDIFSSTQNLATNAAALGMIPNATPYFLDLSTASIFAAPGSADPAGCGGACNLVPNSLLAGVPVIDPNAVVPVTAAQDAATAAPTAPVAPTTPAAPLTPVAEAPAAAADALPSPVTR